MIKQLSSTDFYNLNSEQLFHQYQSLPFEQVHAAWLDYLPATPERALDVGAGSGRDAGWLANKGWSVTAIEPSDKLRAKAIAQHGESQIQWLSDTLPSLETLCDSKSYHLILVSAVWMHLTPAQQTQSLQRLRRLQAPGGVIVITWRNIADEQERRFHPIEMKNFEQARIYSTKDIGLRANVEWTTAVFREKP
ncbi:class I SAM-dependent methyltransferase [Hahella sp. CR1]|uniref:class I SAM-dependent methyltransferase n=1 Tax=Hahella sp. CR1 TaxID=2992807 RepID=UPI0024431EA3|nr:class I SAM-dependent methyltransferase [Hahella sp. CR1]MDG9666536.1 class I SAM-dependent methyltransferase [Hahella sp. CR1]